jgi:phosphoserine phosphatase
MWPVCFRPGKVLHATGFAEEHDIDLASSYLYTDSITDLPMLLS